MMRFGLFIVALILLIDGVYLLSLKRIHIGTILPVLIGVIFLIIAVCYPKIQLYLQQSELIQRLWYITWGVFSLWSLSVILFFVYLSSLSHSQSPLNSQAVAMIILGSQVQNKQPSPALKNRLDTALKYQQQFPHIKIVVTGGIGSGEQYSEAEVMGEYLQQHGISASRIILEDQSTSTELNLQNSVALLKQHQIDIHQPILLVTSDFHTIRAKKIAEKIGYRQIQTISASTPLLTRYNSWLREYFAFISGWILREY